MKDVPLAEFRANCFVSETVGLSVAGGMIGAGLGELLVYGFSGAVQLTFFPLRMALGIWVLAVPTIVGLLSAALPSYHASRRDIVDGLRHIG